MAKKKKKKFPKNDIVEGMRVPFTFGAGAIGASIFGQAFQPHIPAGMVNPLTQTGTTMSHFAGPITTISASGVALKELRKVQKKARKKLKGGKK